MKSESWHTAMSRRRKVRKAESALHKWAIEANVGQTSAWKGRVAEAAVLLRLVLRGYEPLRAVFDGDHVDWFVRGSGECVIKLQVRWARADKKYGLPMISLKRKGKSRQKYTDGSIDIFVAYDFF
jgi:hypothetical protein